jgi:hypothetical protein
MIVAIALAAQVAGHISTNCRDHVCVMVDERNLPIGLMDDRDGHVIGKWDKQQRFVVDKPKCEFVYSEKLRTQALMLVEQEFGAHVMRQYDVAHAGITLYRERVELDIMRILPDKNGSYLLDPPSYQITVDPCTNAVLSTTLVNPF